MKSARSLVALLATLLALLGPSGCSSGSDARVLFVGNSYTTSNGLPDVVRGLADSAGQRLDVEVRATGGWWLRDHAASSSTMDAVADGGFDFVVLQEQSMVPAARDLAERESRPAAVRLATEAVEAGSSVVLFMTWAHLSGSADVGHSSYESMQVAIANTYDRLSAATTGKVAPVGAAWWMTLAERPDIGLYQPDGSHPSPAGTYLAAAVIAGTITGVDPLEFDDDAGLAPGAAEALREFASRAAAGERPWG